MTTTPAAQPPESTPPRPSDDPAALGAAGRGGLLAWGVVLIVVGVLASLGAIASVFHWVQLFERSLAPPARGASRAATPTMSWTDAIGLLLALAAAAGLLWTGVGSCLARRWVRPVVVNLCALVVFFGLLHFVAILLTLPSLLEATESAAQRSGGAGPSQFAVIALLLMRSGLVLGLAVALPYFAMRFYLAPRTARTLDLLDPRVTWADRCPIPVLGWAAYSGLVALSAAMRLNQPALPAFTFMLTGTAATVALAALVVLLAWGAWLTYRMERLGWVITFVLLVALRAATATFLWTGGDPGALVTDPADAAQWARVRRADVVPEWLPAVLSTLEALAVAGAGLYVARHLPRSYSVNLVSRSGQR